MQQSCFSNKEAEVPNWGCAYFFWFYKQFPKNTVTDEPMTRSSIWCAALFQSPLNRPMVRRHPFTGSCPVRIATTIFSWCLPNLSRSSAIFLHGLPIKSLLCLQPSISFQVLKCWCSVQFLIASLAKRLGIPRAGYGPSIGIADACLASLSACSLPRMPWCPGTQTKVTSLRLADAKRASRHSATTLEVTFGPLSALNAAWLSEQLRICLFL